MKALPKEYKTEVEKLLLNYLEVFEGILTGVNESLAGGNVVAIHLLPKF